MIVATDSNLVAVAFAVFDGHFASHVVVVVGVGVLVVGCCCWLR